MAVSGNPASEDGAPGVPPAFREAVEALRSARLRPEIVIGDTPAPRKLASYAFALTATVEVDGEELADGRLVLLHEPGGHEAWNGEFRLVSLGRAELEPEMADDPLLAEVGWSWLTEGLDQQGARYTEPSGTVSRCSSHYFGGLAERETSTEIEIRASWTPLTGAGSGQGSGLSTSPGPGQGSGAAPGGRTGASAGAGRGVSAGAGFAEHLRAWCELLCLCAGLPPAPAAPVASPVPVGGVVPMPTRRRPL
ncbi:DUF3000 domain-containing protein [Streptacidiphilus cavernicola]|uniref:DUF3000 domain-containing protein n=1 Tax=Streptacidiphilus cavernicola TaxID=3342716 RepID=A0ABV6W519_9ACTN